MESRIGPKKVNVNAFPQEAGDGCLGKTLGLGVNTGISERRRRLLG